MNAVGLLAGYGTDLLLGDPARWHPVAGVGHLAAGAERRGYAPTRVRGALISAGLVCGAAAGARQLASVVGETAALGVVLWAALGGRSLRREAHAVEAHIEAGELDLARARLRSLCGRDAQELEAVQLRQAVIESVAENTSDAVVGALLWGALCGPAGVAAYRVTNTLDAMFGHRSARYERFGWAPARTDDLLNWPSARLSAGLAIVLAPCVGGSPVEAERARRADADAHPSPNAGQVEAAFAGALGLALGGPLAYAGRVEGRPWLNPGGRPPRAGDVDRAVRLSAWVGGASALVCALTCAGLAADRPGR